MSEFGMENSIFGQMGNFQTEPSWGNVEKMGGLYSAQIFFIATHFVFISIRNSMNW